MLRRKLDDGAPDPDQVLLIVDIPITSDENVEPVFVGGPEQITIRQRSPSGL